MNENQKAAYIIAQSALLSSEIAAMQAANAECAYQGRPPEFGLEAFRHVIEEYGAVIGHNAVLGLYGDQ